MLTLDPGIDVAAVARVVDAEYGRGDPLCFVPVGGDSWCFEARPWWVSVRRDREGHVPGAYEAAATLRREGFDFILAPLAARSGGVVHDAGGRPIVVFPFMDGAELMPTVASAREVEAVAAMIGRLHCATGRFDVPRESFELPFNEELDAGVSRAVAGAHAAGPYGEDVTRLVNANHAHLLQLRDELDEVRRACQQDNGDFVLTHGEPTNVFACDDGSLLLMDFGSLCWAPPERDSARLADFGVPWPSHTRPHVRRFYELRWILSEIAEYVDRFTTTHTGNIGDDDKWHELLRYLQRNA